MNKKISIFTFYLVLIMMCGNLTITSNAEGKPKEKAYGSGAIISSKGLVVTCAHVVDGGNNFYIYFGNHKHVAELIEVINDNGQDLALLRCPDLEGKPFFSIKPSGTVKPGETVYAMGFPEADVLGSEVKITKGEISSKTGYKNDSNIWQTSVDVYPGSSGGPFLDEWGNMIGLANSYIPEERISYCTKIQLLLDAVEAYIGEMKIIPASMTSSRESGLAMQLYSLIRYKGSTKMTMSEIREASDDKVVLISVE